MYSSVLTKIGAAQLLNSQIIGTTLKWSKMGVGDGGGHTVTPDANKTALAREKYRAGINHLYRDPNDATQIIAELVMLPEEGGYTIREVGIYDVNDNLVVYGSLPEVVKPVLAEGSGVTLTIRCRATIGNATNIKLIIDPSTVMATRQYVGDVLQKYFPLTGGTLTGNITYNGNSDFSIARYTDTGRTVLRGGTTYNDGANIYLNGKNYSGDVGAPGAIKFMASNGAQSGTLDLTPDGTLTLNGMLSATYLSCNKTSENKNFDFNMPEANGGGYFLDGSGDLNKTWYKILTTRDQPYTAAPLPKVAGGVGQFFSSTGTGSSFTLPSGGTWQYMALLQFDNGVFSTGGRGGIGAGGTTITLDAQGHSVCRTLCFFWRLG